MYDNKKIAVDVIGRRAVGSGVMEAFYEGFETIDLDDYDFICKLDLDLK